MRTSVPHVRGGRAGQIYIMCGDVRSRVVKARPTVFTFDDRF